MANKVTTQWFDIHVKRGNYLPLEKQSTLAEEQLQIQEAKAETEKIENKLDSMTVQQIQEAEDDLDMDDDFTRQYMANRRREIQEIASRNKYGVVLEISRDEYIREVTEADPGSFVVLHLYQDSNEFCGLINMHLPELAKRFGHVKFIKIIASKCIDNFPDQRCPCFIIYKAGKPVSNVTHMDKVLKGDVTNLSDFLASHHIFPL